MDPSQEFAQAMLDRLRRELKRLEGPTLASLQAELGRHDRFFARVELHQLKMQDLFAFGRLLGFRPSELLRRFGGLRRTWILPGAAAYFSSRGQSLKKAGCSWPQLKDFMEWGREILVEEDGQDLTMDLDAHLKAIGLDLPVDDALRFADLVLSFYAKHGPETLSYRSARQLVGSMILVVEMLRKFDRRDAAFDLLGISFQLEAQIQDIDLRYQLYEIAGRICLESGWTLDGIWCLREAGFLALLVPDFEQARALHEEAREKAAAAGLVEDWGRSACNAVGDAEDDLGVLMELMGSDRRASPLSASELDRHLGAQKAFTMAMRRRAPMSLERWGRFLSAVKINPSSQSRRLAMLDWNFPSPEPLIERLKGREPDSPEARWQTEILGWTRQMTIGESEKDLQLFDAPFWREKTSSAYGCISEGLDQLCRDLPSGLSSRDASRLHSGLVLASHILARRALFGISADSMTAAFSVQSRLKNIASDERTFALRTASALALEVGDVEVAGVFLDRAKIIDVMSWNPTGLMLTLFREGVVAEVVGDYKQSLDLHRACLKVVDDYGGVSSEMLYLSLARSNLRIGNIPEVKAALKTLQPSPDAQYFPDFLRIKAEYLSHLGSRSEPIELLDKAIAICKEAERMTDMVLMGIEKCKHFLRSGRSTEARGQVGSLLTMASCLRRNPVGRAAIFQMSSDVIAGTWALDSIQETIHRVQHPNLIRLDRRDHRNRWS